MKLHYPAAVVVLVRNEQHERRLELVLSICVRDRAVESCRKDCLEFLLAGEDALYCVEAVVAELAAVSRKEVHALLEGSFEVSKCVNLHARSFAELCDILRPSGLLDVHSLIGSPCRKNFRLEAGVCGDLLVPLEGVHRIVSGADSLDVALGDEVSCSEVGAVKSLVAEIPDFLSSFCAQDSLIAEVLAKLKMAPVVQWVSYCTANNLCPFRELFVLVCVSRDEFLRDSCTAHEPPLVVISAEPHLSDALVVKVLVDFLRVQVAVVVDDRAGSCRLVKELFSCLGVEQEIFVHK